jgi:hypothetical protein
MKRRAKKDYTFVGVTLLVVLLALVLVLSILLNLRDLNAGTAGNSGIAPSVVRPYIYSLKNISYGYLSNFNGGPGGMVPVVSISGINISASSNAVYAGQNPGMYINVVYSGTFAFQSYNVTRYLQNVINFYYVGFYRDNGSMYVIGNGNSGRYFREDGTPLIYTPENESGSHYMALRMQVNATGNATGIWNFCAGFFGSYKNDSSWGKFFYNLSGTRTNFTNTSMINIVSGNCKKVEVK